MANWENFSGFQEFESGEETEAGPLVERVRRFLDQYPVKKNGEPLSSDTLQMTFFNWGVPLILVAPQEWKIGAMGSWQQRYKNPEITKYLGFFPIKDKGREGVSITVDNGQVFSLSSGWESHDSNGKLSTKKLMDYSFWHSILTKDGDLQGKKIKDVAPAAIVILPLGLRVEVSPGEFKDIIVLEESTEALPEEV